MWKMATTCVGVLKPWLFVNPCLFIAIQLCWNFKPYCFHFFPKSALLNWGCGASTDAAYTRTFTVLSPFQLTNVQVAQCGECWLAMQGIGSSNPCEAEHFFSSSLFFFYEETTDWNVVFVFPFLVWKNCLEHLITSAVCGYFPLVSLTHA